MSFNQAYMIRHHAEVCLDCYKACIEALPHCLKQGGRYAESKHVTLLYECAEMARLTSIMITNCGPFVHELTQLCSKMCKAMVSSCEDIDKVDPVMNRCVKACLKCVTVLSEKTPAQEGHESNFKPPQLDQYIE